MNDSDITLDIIARIRAQKSGIFGEREDGKAALDYAHSLFHSDQDINAATIALMVYHNTLLEEVAKALEEQMEKASKIDPPTDVPYAITVTYTDQYPKEHLMQLLGAIPLYFSDSALPPTATLKERVTKGYCRSAGMEPNWHEQEETELSADGDYTYPDDPTLKPLMSVTCGLEKFYLYDYGLAAYRSAPDAAAEHCRLD